MSDTDRMTAIRDAAIRLAGKQSWRDVTLAAIAAEAGLTLAETAREVGSKIDILRSFSRDLDNRLLVSLETAPLDGEPHDRLFDIMLRRIEMLTPHKQALRSIAAAPADGPAEFLALVSSAIETQTWLLAAAGIETPGTRGELHKLGLVKINADVLRIWLDDDDPGLARTMAALDRKLRDGEVWLKRLDIPLAMCKGFASAFRAYREARRAPANASSSPDATAD
jgi:ubiquinone biosynthesis protein COQ9